MMNNKLIFQVDSFTDEPFKGNPAGVMIIDESVTEDWMQNIAAEMNLSETAFILPMDNFFSIRYFTPTKEVPLCGHATLASAHVLFQNGMIQESGIIRFKANMGDLSVKKESGLIVMNFPCYPLEEIAVPDNIEDNIGFKPIEMYSSIDEWIIAIAKTESEIKNSSPDFKSLLNNGWGHLMITAKAKSPDTDFVVRCFAPFSGIDEDPVTGSAHCALTPLWAKKLGKTEMNSVQVSKRTGKLKVKLINDRVEISGQALTIFEAVLKI